MRPGRRGSWTDKNIQLPRLSQITHGGSSGRRMRNGCPEAAQCLGIIAQNIFDSYMIPTSFLRINFSTPFHLRNRQVTCKPCFLFALGWMIHFLNPDTQIHARFQRNIRLQAQAFPAQINGNCGLLRSIPCAKLKKLYGPARADSPLSSSFVSGVGLITSSAHRIAPSYVPG